MAGGAAAGTADVSDIDRTWYELTAYVSEGSITVEGTPGSGRRYTLRHGEPKVWPLPPLFGRTGPPSIDFIMLEIKDRMLELAKDRTVVYRNLVDSAQDIVRAMIQTGFMPEDPVTRVSHISTPNY